MAEDADGLLLYGLLGLLYGLSVWAIHRQAHHGQQQADAAAPRLKLIVGATGEHRLERRAS